MTPIELERLTAFDAILREWLGDASTVLFVGHWPDGAVAELFPEGRAELTKAAYHGKYAGLRDLAIEGERHHMHFDLARFTEARYSIWPSVCYGWKPSFEMRLVGPDDRSTFALATGDPYDKGQVRPEPVEAFFRRLLEQRQRFGNLITTDVRDSSAPVAKVGASWREIGQCLWRAAELNGSMAFDESEPLRSMESVIETALSEVPIG